MKLSDLTRSDPDLAVEDAWDPLPATQWGEKEASHLLRRLGYSATPSKVRQALNGSIQEILNQSFEQTRTPEKDAKLAHYEKTFFERNKAIRNTPDETKRRSMRQELYRENDGLFHRYLLQWFHFARREENSPQEKFVAFLRDIFVVEQKKVRKTHLLFGYNQTLREGIQLNYPELCKRISRDPAMIQYLDLDKSVAKKPNENFARELFELFILGPGAYGEDDIKEAARAFTGYRIARHQKFYFNQSIHDYRLKTIFGKTGRWNGDEVIELAFQQPAAQTFFIQELIRFYLTDSQPPPEKYIQALGERWADHDFNLRYLINTFFQSRIFYLPQYLGNLVKSPTHFYLGLCQDLQLEVMPFFNRIQMAMRVMGQNFHNPPNVRGWLYGKNWINATTISGRRQLVEYLFSPLNEKKLNGNEQDALKAARKEGKDSFLANDELLRQLLKVKSEDLATHLTKRFIPSPFCETYQNMLEMLIARNAYSRELRSIRDIVIALLQSPAYNLC